jgi:hypothetical protein
MTSPAQAHKAVIPAELMRSAECMLDVLRKSPDVSEPRLSSDTSEGWFHPFLEYKEVSAKAWRYRFDAQRNNDGHFWFLARRPGMGVTEADLAGILEIIREWKTSCGIDANLITL